MAPTNAKSLMKDFRASFRRKKVTDPKPKIDKDKLLEEEELAKLEELKENAGANIIAGYTDAKLLSFIRARSNNVKEAEKLLNLDINVKKFLKIEEFLTQNELDEVNTNYSVSGIIGYDKEGFLVRVINFGYSDVKGFINCVSTLENFRLFMWYVEKDSILQEMENKKTGRNKVQMSYIFNLEGMSLHKVMHKPAIDTAIVALKLLQDHYHDTVKTVYCINAPTFTSTVLKLLKPALQDNLYQKIKIYEGESGKMELLKHIDAEVLPVYLGGKRIDSNNDPMCKSFIKFGGTIPDHLYPGDFLSTSDPEVTYATVPANSFLNFVYNVPCPGTKISFFISAKENDIGIGVYLDTEDSTVLSHETKSKKKTAEDMEKMQPIVPVIRCQCQLAPVAGYFITWFTGTVYLHFDNTYSWMSSKDVIFKITVEPPEA